MKWKTRNTKMSRADRRMQRLRQWHKHFALLPVQIGDEVYWLTWVERRIQPGYLDLEPTRAMYRLPREADR